MHGRSSLEVSERTTVAALWGAITLCVLVMASAADAGTVLYVDDDAPPAGNGLTWETAYRFLQDALTGTGTGTEIRIAQGAHFPDRSEFAPGGSGDTNTTFHFTGQTILGGFAGLGSPNPDERAPDKFPTVLSGDLDGDGELNSGNALHVVTILGGGPHLIEGCIIEFGRAASTDPLVRIGGGVYNRFGNVDLVDCVLRSNLANLGAGLYSHAGRVDVVNCTVRDNLSGEGGTGIYVQHAMECEIAGTTFINNQPLGGSTLGGGVRGLDCDVTIRECTFTQNDAYQGGGIYFEGENDTLTIEGSTFQGNFANSTGGAIYHRRGDSTVTGSFITANHANQRGGGIYHHLGTLHVSSCEFEGNSSVSSGGAFMNAQYSEATIEDSTFIDNAAGVDFGNPGGAGIWSGGGTIARCYFEGNVGRYFGGAVQINTSPVGSALISDSTFLNNTACNGAGVAIDGGASEGPFVISRCVFIGNASQPVSECFFVQEAQAYGAGVFVQAQVAEISVVNSLFALNQASRGGGGIYCDDGRARVLSCTITGNDGVEPAGSGLLTTGELVTVSNTILWDNGDGTESNQVAGVVQVDYSCIEGLSGSLGGEGNIGHDPHFSDPAAGDWRIAAGSRCIDAGDNTTVPKDLTLDLEGNERMLDDPGTPDTGRESPPIVDIGAFEFTGTSCIADVDGSGDVGLSDVLAILAAWGPCDENCPEDVDRDGQSGFGDVLAVLAHWGECG